MSTPSQPPPQLTHAALLSAAKAFCTAFSHPSSPNLPSDLLTTHFTRNHPAILIHEHGQPSPLTPFLGVPFRGAAGVAAYLDAVSSCLTFREMEFGEFIVDEKAAKVAVRGAGVFTWKVPPPPPPPEAGEKKKKKKQEWREEFVYVLGFDGEGRVSRWEVWADSGAAGRAARGEL